MKFLRHLLGMTKLDKEKNRCAREEREHNIVEEIKQYQKKWLQHVQMMDTNRIPKQALRYRPKGRRNIGRPKKRWRDQLHFEDQGTGNTPNPSGTWWTICILSFCHSCYNWRNNFRTQIPLDLSRSSRCDLGFITSTELKITLAAANYILLLLYAGNRY